jgi:hypothetical protein
MAEFTGKDSMQTPHHRALLDGAVAAQGYFRLLTLCDIEESPFDKAFVGTIESNAEIIIGNAHWAAKPRDKTRKVEYHMRRVFHHFTRGITLRAFLICREQARQFRRHFHDVQEDLLAKLRRLRVPNPEPRSYSTQNVEELKRSCRDRKLRTSGTKAELMRRLRDHEAGQVAHPDPARTNPSLGEIDISNASTRSVRRKKTFDNHLQHLRREEQETSRMRSHQQESRHFKKRKSQ